MKYISVRIVDTERDLDIFRTSEKLEDGKKLLDEVQKRELKMRTMLDEDEHCVCRKCGEAVSCEMLHGTGEPHQESLCGNCV